jgi:Protein of unknown function (DUF2795)
MKEESAPKESVRKGEKSSEEATASERSPAAAAVAEIFSNVEFPKDKSELVSHAEKNKENTRYPKELMDAIYKMRDRKYVSIQDIYREIGHISSVESVEKTR